MHRDPSTRHALPSIARLLNAMALRFCKPCRKFCHQKALRWKLPAEPGSTWHFLRQAFLSGTGNPATRSLMRSNRLRSGARILALPMFKRRLCLLSPRWPPGADEFTGKFDFIYCANMFHIAPWSACAGLMQMFHLSTPHYSEWL